MILTGRPVREGGLLAGLERADLPRNAGVALALVVRVEAVDSLAMMRKPDAVALQAVLENPGVESIPENGCGAGVQVRKADKGETN